MYPQFPMQRRMCNSGNVFICSKYNVTTGTKVQKIWPLTQVSLKFSKGVPSTQIIIKAGEL